MVMERADLPKEIEQALLSAIYDQGAHATVTTAIRAVSKEFGDAQEKVREVYWQLMDDHRVIRKPDGHLKLIGQDAIDMHVKRVVAAAPPLTPEQRDRIAALLRTSARK